jgi:hypothetical protein
MAITKQAALEALATARQSENKSAEYFSYTRLAPYLFVTGFLWLSADLGLRFVPVLRGWAWPAAVTLAIASYIALGFRNGRGEALAEVLTRWCLAVSFAAAAFLVLQPSGHEIHGIMGVATGAAFTALGLRYGSRLLLLGVAIAILSVVVHLTLGPGDNILVMGLVGGGGMMLGAWWLARI